MRLTNITRRTLVAGSAWAQAAWPSKPITLIVPFPPGGPTDVVSRIVGKELADRLGQPVIVENKAGASGSIAAQQVKRAAPDGHTLMMLATPTLFAPLFFRNAGYEVTKDFTPISMVYDLPIAMVVNPEKLPGVTTLPQLIETARAKKGELNYTTSGAGSFGHMSMELLKEMGQFDMQHVAYRGGVPAITDTIGGQVPIMYADLVAALPHIKSGKLVAIAVGSPERGSCSGRAPEPGSSGHPGAARCAAAHSGRWSDCQIHASGRTAAQSGSGLHQVVQGGEGQGHGGGVSRFAHITSLFVKSQFQIIEFIAAGA